MWGGRRTGRFLALRPDTGFSRGGAKDAKRAMQCFAGASFTRRHPGLDPGSMNRAIIISNDGVHGFRLSPE